MKLKEFLKSSSLTNTIATRPVSGIGTNKFRITLDKENVKTPHYRMMKVEDLLEDRTSLMQGARQLTLFLMPNLKFISSDERSSVFANEWLNKRDKLERELMNFILIGICGGNGYLEPQWRKMKNDKKVLDMLWNVPMPSTIYVNTEDKDGSKYWIVEYPIEVMRAEGQKLQWLPVNYTMGSYTWRHNIWGITRSKDELYQMKFLWSKSPFYGSGLLSSAIDNEDVAEEILKNWALAAKYRSLSKKIIGFYNQDGESIDPSELDRIQQEFANLEEEDSLLVNKRFESSDLTFTGADNMMDNELSFLRRDTGSALTPNFMTAFSQDSSMATAAEAKVPFGLSIDATQKLIEGFLNNIITKSLKESYSWLADDLELKLGKADLYSRSETFMNVSQLYNNRAATFNEYRQAAGLEPVEGGDKWGWEPPLDNTTKSVTIQENVKAKALKEKYKKELLQISKPLLKKEKVVNFMTTEEFKKIHGKDKNSKQSFKEAVGDLLK